MKSLNSILGVIIFLLVVSCSLIFETDLSDEEVILNSPLDNTVTPTQTQTFWWDHVADAERYNLLLVSPTFDSVARLVVDTNISDNKYVATLSPGTYQWGISAYNASSATDYSIFNLNIDTLNGISYQIIRLNTPQDNATLNNQNITFKWDALDGASFYLLDVKDSIWSIGKSVESSPRLTENNYSVSLSEGYYTWGVAGYDDASNTNTSWSVFNLWIDITPPGKPILSNPSYHGDTLDTEPFAIEWNHSAASLTAISDSIIISTDSLFSGVAIVEEDFVSNRTYSVADLNDGGYFVKVKSIDAAGNKSEFCQVRRFYLLKDK